jgi:hypothetical protein
MSAAPGLPRFVRLLLALGAGGGPAAAEYAARLADLFEIPLDALYIEDEELLAVAGLPFVREVSWLGLRRPLLDPAGLERELRRQAVRLERQLRSALAGGRVPCRFEVVRGRTAVALGGALRPGDLLVLSRELGPVTGPGRLGSGVRAVLEGAWSALLLLDEVLPVPSGPVTTWYDASPAGERSLTLALRLAQGQGRRLRVLLPAAATAVEMAELRRRVRPEATVPTELIRLSPAADPLAQLAALRGGLLVLADRSLALSGARLEELLWRSRTPLLLFRMPG